MGSQLRQLLRASYGRRVDSLLAASARRIIRAVERPVRFGDSRRAIVHIERVPSKGVRGLCAKDVDAKTYHQATEETKLLHSERLDDLNRTTGLNTLKVSGDNVRSSQPHINFGDEKPRFRRRVKAKISKWMRGTRVALYQVRVSTRMEPAL